MEQVRLLLAIVLSFLVFFLWNLFLVDPESTRQTEPPGQEASQQVQEPRQRPYIPQEGEGQSEPESAMTVKSLPEAPAAETARTIHVSTAMLDLKVSEKGALVKSVLLKAYRETIDNDSPLHDMIFGEANPGSLAVGFAADQVTGWETAVYAADSANDTITVTDKPEKLTFTWVSPTGIVVEKAFTFFPDDYLIGLKVSLKNGSDRELREFFSLSLTKYMPKSKTRFGFEGASALLDNRLLQVDTDDLDEKNSFSGPIGWMAVQDRYFMSGVIPEKAVETSFQVDIGKDFLLESAYLQPIGTLLPGSQKTFDFHLFFGPKSLSLLKSYDYQLDEAIDFGWFDFIAKPVCGY